MLTVPKTTSFAKFSSKGFLSSHSRGLDGKLLSAIVLMTNRLKSAIVSLIVSLIVRLQEVNILRLRNDILVHKLEYLEWRMGTVPYLALRWNQTRIFFLILSGFIIYILLHIE